MAFGFLSIPADSGESQGKDWAEGEAVLQESGVTLALQRFWRLRYAGNIAEVRGLGVSLVSGFALEPPN